MTEVEKIYAVIQQLRSIPVPAGFTDTVSIPIYNAAIVLDTVYKSLKQKNELNIPEDSSDEK